MQISAERVSLDQPQNDYAPACETDSGRRCEPLPARWLEAFARSVSEIFAISVQPVVGMTSVGE